MKTLKLLFVIIVLSSCTVSRTEVSSEFYFQFGKIYHVGEDTTIVDSRAIRILKIDSLTRYYKANNQIKHRKNKFKRVDNYYIKFYQTESKSD